MKDLVGYFFSIKSGKGRLVGTIQACNDDVAVLFYGNKSEMAVVSWSDLTGALLFQRESDLTEHLESIGLGGNEQNTETEHVKKTTKCESEGGEADVG